MTNFVWLALIGNTKAGMDDVITKPIDRCQLQQKLSSYPSRRIQVATPTP
jgi:CheY-like chemotaxis protein